MLYNVLSYFETEPSMIENKFFRVLKVNYFWSCLEQNLSEEILFDLPTKKFREEYIEKINLHLLRVDTLLGT